MYGELSNIIDGSKITVYENSSIIIGRGQKEDGCDFTIYDDYMSRKHAEIFLRNELCIQDMDSKNGSFVNGVRMGKNEIIPLSEGDFIKLGKTELKVHICENERKSEFSGEFKYQIRNSVGGRKLQVETFERGCLEFQIRMIEENPSLCISEVIHVSNIDRDCFLCDLGSSLSLKDIINNGKQKLNGLEVVEKIVKHVKLGEEHMLDRSRYIISSDTIFMDSKGSLKLIYVPCNDRKRDNFSDSMEDLCEFLAENSENDIKEKLMNLKNWLIRDEYNTSDIIKEIYRYKDYGASGISLIKNKDNNKKIKIKLEYVVAFFSFVLLMIVYWMDILSITNMIAFVLIISGINLMVYGLSKDNKESIKNIIRSNNKSKKNNKKRNRTNED